MSNENQSIHDFDFNLICEYFSGMKRQGPGSTASTIKALGFIDNLTPAAQIADIGCGSGYQTIDLANNAPGHITAIDLFPVFIGLLNENINKLNIQNRIKTVVGDMKSLPFQSGELDLIWSEGAIYNVGFERGLNEWKKFLKPGGYIAVTEASWFTEERPGEIFKFWNDAYPAIDTIANKVAQMSKAGYVPVASFILPEECWTEHYYLPQIKGAEIFLEKHKGNPAAEGLVANEKHEALMYSRYKEFYGYVFYIGKKM